MDMRSVSSCLTLLNKNVGKSFEEENKMIDIRVGDVVQLTDKDRPTTVVEGKVEGKDYDVYSDGEWFRIERVSGSFYVEFWNIEILERKVELPKGEGALVAHKTDPQTYGLFIRRVGLWYRISFLEGAPTAWLPEEKVAQLLDEGFEVVFEGV